MIQRGPKRDNKSGSTRPMIMNDFRDSKKNQLEESFKSLSEFCQTDDLDRRTPHQYDSIRMRPVVSNLETGHDSRNTDLMFPNFRGEQGSNIRENKTFLNRKPKEPDTSDGIRIEWNDYLCHFEQIAEWNGWTDHEKALQLAKSFRGTAQRVLGELPREVICQYETFLIQIFVRIERITAHRCEFINRLRNREESVAEYGYALKRNEGKLNC